VRLVQRSGKSIGQMALELGIGDTALRRWVAQAEIEAGRGPAGVLKRSEREERVELRRENERLRMEREILNNFRMPEPLGSVGWRSGYHHRRYGIDWRVLGASLRLEAHGFEVLLVNARDVKNVPGRKTDVNDAQWLQQLHQHGLPRGSLELPRFDGQFRAWYF
jgi:transposase-like protein